MFKHWDNTHLVYGDARVVLECATLHFMDFAEDKDSTASKQERRQVEQNIQCLLEEDRSNRCKSFTKASSFNSKYLSACLHYSQLYCNLDSFVTMLQINLCALIKEGIPRNKVKALKCIKQMV